MATAFHDVRLPVDIEKGAVGGPNFLTTLLEFTSGQEQRNQSWARAKHTYDVGYGIQTKDDYAVVRSFFYARRGRLFSFRFKDWLDFEALNEPIGITDGTHAQFQLSVSYVSGDQTFVRKITRPVVGSVTVTVDGIDKSFTLNSLGLFTLSAVPTSGKQVAASFEFDVPVRFDIDQFQVHADFFTSGVIPSIKLKETIE